jgi:hypothetical protein
MLALAKAMILGSESRGTRDHTLLSQFRDFETLPTWRAKSPYLYPPGTGWPSLYPQALGFLFVASYDSQGYGGGIEPISTHKDYDRKGSVKKSLVVSLKGLDANRKS